MTPKSVRPMSTAHAPRSRAWPLHFAPRTRRRPSTGSAIWKAGRGERRRRHPMSGPTNPQPGPQAELIPASASASGSLRRASCARPGPMMRIKTAKRLRAALVLLLPIFVNVTLVCAYLWPDSFPRFRGGHRAFRRGHRRIRRRASPSGPRGSSPRTCPSRRGPSGRVPRGRRSGPAPAPGRDPPRGSARAPARRSNRRCGPGGA